MSSEHAPPSKPRFSLEVAVVGNRWPGEEAEPPSGDVDARLDQARSALEQVWHEITEGMLETRELALPMLGGPDDPESSLRVRDFFDGAKPRLGVLSSLAAGVDQIGARTALQHGERQEAVELELEAILPFPEKDYPGLSGYPRPEFQESEAEGLRELANRAQQVVRLDGIYTVPHGSPVPVADFHRVAYRQCAEVLLQNSDLLVAIYDPDATPEPAGTVETMIRALEADMPVLAVLVKKNAWRVKLYRTLSERRSQAEAEWNDARPEGPGWKSDLRTCIHYLLALPHMHGKSGDEADIDEERKRSLAEAVSNLRLFFGDTPLHPICTCSWRAPLFRGAWSWMLAVAKRCASEHRFERLPQTGPQVDSVTLPPYKGYFDRASALAMLYMDTYRGSFVLAFGLAALAVAVAVTLLAMGLLGALAAAEEHGAHPSPLFWIIFVPLCVLKLGILLALLGLEQTNREDRHQERAADFRYLSELFRPMQWLAPLGMAPPSAELPAHYARLDPRQGWTRWLFRALGRATPTITVPPEFDPAPHPHDVAFGNARTVAILEAARAEWLPDQIEYHRRRALEMHAIESGFERLGQWLLAVVLLCAAAAVLGELAPRWHYVGIPEPPHWVLAILGGAAAAIPAAIAALGGISSQAEARRLRIVSETMVEKLRESDRRLKERLTPQQGVTSCSAGQDLRSIAGTMLDESSDWRALYPLFDVKAG